MTSKTHLFFRVPAVLAVSALGVAVFSPVVSAKASAHLSPANTLITGTLKPGTTLSLSATVDGFQLDVTCTSLTGKGKTPADGLSAPLSAPPAISGCTDSLGGVDTVKTSGKWALSLNAAGSKVTLSAPAKAATFTSSLLSGCVITAAPKSAFKLTGTYDDVNTGSIDSTFPISGAGCSTGGTSTGSGTVVVSPNVSVVK